MVVEQVICNNDVFNDEFFEFPREREVYKIPRWNIIIPTMDVVD